MAGWMRLVTPVLIDAFPDQIINIHLVCCRVSGRPAIEQALDAGVKITGCTVHIVCLEVDSGEFAQAAVPVLPDDTRNASCPNSSPGTRILPPAIPSSAC